MARDSAADGDGRPGLVRRAWSAVATPPDFGPFRDDAFDTDVHDARPAAWLGIALGVLFTACFLTGVTSDLIQNPQAWFSWFPSPPWLFRVNQGIHVFAGLAAIPVLLAKLWVVYPHLFRWPPAKGPSHALERLGIAPLVGGALFLLITGVMNIAYWYPWGFAFTDAHYWAAWITIGALVMHIGAKAGIVSRVWESRRARPAGAAAGAAGAAGAAAAAAGGPAADGMLTRRGLLVASGVAAGTVLTVTLGETVPALRRLAVLAPRAMDRGPQGFPVNKTAAGAGVADLAVDPAWRLTVAGAVARELSFSLDDLRARDLDEAVLTIVCVEGWSVTKRWRGVRLADLVAEAGAGGAEVDVESLQPSGPYTVTRLSPAFVADPSTLLALEVEGEPLHLDHGFPVRLIAPNQPGVLQTKWVSRVVVL